MFSSVLAKPAPRRAAAPTSHTIVRSSRFVDHQVFTLRSRGVLVKAVDQYHAANPLTIGQAIEEELRLPRHRLRITRHLPEDFFILFDVPAHRNRAVVLGKIVIDGATFLLQVWRESDHGVLQTYPFHVRICVERMPLHLWSIEGAGEVLGRDVLVDRLDSRTYTQENMRMFSCWVWCRSLDLIPSKHAFTVFPEGAGRVEEMNDFSPPRRDVAPPPEGYLFHALIHIDLAEDWTVRERRTTASGEEIPYPAVQPFTWLYNVEDGLETRPIALRRLLDGCSGGPAASRRYDRDDDADRQRRHERDPTPRRDFVGRAPLPSQGGLGGSRQSSRTPVSKWRLLSAPAGNDAGEALPPPPPLPRSGPRPQRFDLDTMAPAEDLPPSQQPLVVAREVSPAKSSPPSPSPMDPLAELLAEGTIDRFQWISSDMDPMSNELEAICTAVVASPLSFPSPDVGLADTADGSTPPTNYGLHGPASSMLGQSSPPDEGDMALQVQSLCITDSSLLDALFAAPPSSILATTPPKAKAKEKQVITPRRSTRQAGLPATPAAQRATIRLAKEMAVLGEEEQRSDAAAAVLVQRFKMPLEDTNVDGLAVLTRIDREAILRNAAQSSASRAATAH
ncbi:hypothetical protein ACQ4PT_061686 [Festuca glaucescens]